MKIKILLAAIILISVSASAKKVKPEVISHHKYGVQNTGTRLLISFEKGKEYNHPLFAIWLADENGNYIQTLYVSESIGKGIFIHGSRKTGQWLAGEIERPASLPYWTHQRNIRNENNGFMPTPKRPVADAYTGATPKNSFSLEATTEKPLQGKYKVMFELNQSWDWNDYWYNNKYPNDKEYKTSSQPALIYSANINTETDTTDIELEPIGHSHYSGLNGNMNQDLSTLTTALNIAKKIKVRIVR